MGIPAYYRTLCNKIPSLLVKRLPKEIQVGSLWIDFNCVVYHCIRRPGTEVYPGEEGRIDWENKLIKIIVKYCKNLIEESGIEEGGRVFLGIDGVVPMAKMRQQRKRRFKSAWLYEHEVALGKPREPRWDTNSITPGTAFMERLADYLKAEKRWRVSCAGEPGEGEQKVFELLRKEGTGGKAVVIYGLDADLIVMSLFQQVNQKEKIFLFRENTEVDGGVKYDSITNTEEYRFLNIQLLADTLAQGEKEGQEAKKSYITDYCAAMMLLGNDFIPHSIWFTIRDSGHTILEELLKKVRGQYGNLTEECVWRKEPLRELIKAIGSNEEGRLGAWIYRKFQQNVRSSRDAEEPWQEDLNKWNQTPIAEKDESRLLKFWNDDCVKLADCWRENYYDAYLGAKNKSDIDERCKVYCQGLQWSLTYMTGSGQVSFEWLYPWSYPPLWADIWEYLKREDALNPPSLENAMLKPQEQLALVLPLSSWWLVRDGELKKLPYILPHMWNFELSFCTAGKRLMWECDPHVPLLMPSRLRFLQKVSTGSQIRWDKLNRKDLTLRISESIKTS